MRGIAFCAAVVVTLPTAAGAANWVVVTKSPDGTTYSVDSDGKLSPSAERSFWVKIDRRSRVASPKDRQGSEGLASRGLCTFKGVVSVCSQALEEPAELKELWSVHCTKRTVQVLASVSYTASGEMLRSTSAPANLPSIIVPDTIAENLADLVCG